MSKGLQNNSEMQYQYSGQGPDIVTVQKVYIVNDELFVRQSS